jgi:gliding motility-associated-like protein
MKRIFVFLFLGFGAIKLNAATFTVTSNADAGVGTLREAIILANANGTATADFIHFNLSGLTRTDVSISLESELPILSSNLIIDGTTQPSALLGNANIKVAILRVSSLFFSGLRLDNAIDIQIYGLSFSNFKSDPLGAVDDKKAGIFLYNSKNITIGAPLKSNCFNNSYAGILSPFVIPRFDNVSIKISSNIFGLAEDGVGSQANESGIDISFLNSSTIGGNASEEGNLLGANTRVGMALAGIANEIKISNNKIGLNINSVRLKSASATGIVVNGETASPIIRNNIIGGQLVGIYLDFANGGFKLEGNDIGTNQLGTFDFGNTTGIHVRFCNKGMIGGDNLSQGNNIAYNATGVLLEIAYPISMLKNSFYCNSTAAVTFKNLLDGKVITQSRISTITATNVSGIYLPNSKVELFYTDSCPDCQGKKWLATLLTDATGNWSYNGPITGKITSMGTNADGATSTFSKPLIDNASASIAGVVCGATTGSIEVDVYDASAFAWYNVNNPTVVVSTERKLINVGAGTYFLRAGQNGLCDPPPSQNFTIDANTNGINDLKMTKNSTYCGSKTGFIKGITIANDPPRIWYNSRGNEVGYEDDLIDQLAGDYYFKTGTGQCTVTSKVYNIPDIVVAYKIKQIRIVDATCGNNNGSIIISSYETEKPTKFTWYDAQNNEYATTENLTGLAPGKYKLVAGGINGCSNTVGEYLIGESALPVIDYSALQKYISCDGKTITVQGVNVSGSTAPYTYTWVDDTGTQVSSQLNFINIQLGKYRLIVSDKNGCIVEGEELDFTELKSMFLNVPNSITPNGDGINDVWEIKGAQNYPDGDFSIFNRTGNRVFYSRGYSKTFNGMYNGKLMPTGVYYYVIDLKTDCGKMSGSLTILR